MKIINKILSIILILSVFFALLLPLTIRAEADYSLSGTWQFNEVPDLSGATGGAGLQQDINFITYGGTYDTFKRITFFPDSISFSAADGSGKKYAYELGFGDWEPESCSYTVWDEENARIVNFGSTPQSVSEEFYNVFIKAAKQISAVSSDPLEDFTNCPEFNASDYPENLYDFSLSVYQIAESTDDNLYIYVYRPSGSTQDYEAKYINMCVNDPSLRSPSYKLYDLKLVENSGVFDKYLVKGFKVSNDSYRYYNIAAIYRLYDSNVDSSYETVDYTRCKGYPVAQTWCAYYEGGALKYEMAKLDIVEIDITATGIIRYSEGFKLYTDKCDSHYVAFNVENYNVDMIYDADITYSISNYAITFDLSTGQSYTSPLGVEGPFNETLSSSDTGSNEGKGLAKKYIWNRISTVDEFISEVENSQNDGFSEAELTGLADAEFVFRFTETDYERSTGLGSTVTKYSVTDNFGILRLHFLSEGQTYNLGCVSDLVGTDNIPEGEVTPGDNIQNIVEEAFEEAGEDYLGLILIIGGIIILICIAIFFRPVFNTIIKGIVEIFSFLWGIITMPFEALSSKNKNNRKK